MPILKGEQVEEFDNVTIIITSELTTRHGFFNDRLHLVLSEANKDTSVAVAVCEDGSEMVDSTVASNIDVIIDFPSKKNLKQTIQILNGMLNDWEERDLEATTDKLFSQINNNTTNK